jgi:hypothetical protein
MILAACPEAKCRDGKKAVEAATRACELTEWKKADCLDTLAAAYAESGDFNAAVMWERKAIAIVADERNKDAFRSRVALYQARKPYREILPGRASAEARP